MAVALGISISPSVRVAMPQDQGAFDWPSLAKTFSRRFKEMAGGPLSVLHELLDQARTIVECSESAFLAPDAKGETLRFAVSVNSRPEISEVLAGIKVPCATSIAGYVYSTGQPIAIANPEDFYQEVDAKTGLKTEIYMVVPVIDADTTLGVATFLNRPEGKPSRPFDDNDIDSAQRIAELLAVGWQFVRRLNIQYRLLRSEFTRVASQWNTELTTESLLNFPTAADDSSPLTRLMLDLENLPPRELELAAEIIRALTRFSE